jgi:LacI family transcriptional regulator
MDSRWDFFGGSVNLDYPGMLRLGVETLISKGCRKLAMVGWGYRWVGDAGEMDDFRKTVEAHGLDFRPDWVQTSMAPAKGSGWEDLREVWRASRTRPDGLLIADDMLLPDVDLAIRELGLRVPDQLQVVLATSRDLPHQASFPLTRIENDMDDFGDKMVEILFDLMAGRQPATRQFVVGYRVAQEGAQRGVSSGGRAVAAVSSGAGSAVPSRVGREG